MRLRTRRRIAAVSSGALAVVLLAWVFETYLTPDRVVDLLLLNNLCS